MIWLLSYGFKVPFLGLDQLLTEAKLPVTGLPSSWIPLAAVVLTILLAVAFAVRALSQRGVFCRVANNTAGTAFSLWRGDLLRNISSGRELHLPLDVLVVVPAATHGLAKGKRTRRPRYWPDCAGHSRRNSACTLVEWKCDLPVRAANRRVASVFWIDDNNSAQFSEHRRRPN